MLRVMFYSFFVVPFLIVVGGAAVFVAISAVTSEDVDAYTLLDSVMNGGSTQRWLSAYQLSLLLSNPKSVPADPRFCTALIGAFEQAAHERNPEVRQYLAVAMGRVAKPEFLQPLVRAINQDQPENRPYLIHAIGCLRSKQAIEHLVPWTKDSDARNRLEAIAALGRTGDARAVSALAEGLRDSEPNVQWEAAVALAKLGDSKGKDVLLQLLNRDYLRGFSGVDGSEQTHILSTAIQASRFLNDPILQAAVQRLANEDEEMIVRELAMASLKGAQ